MLAATGITVFAPNVRGSTGFGRQFSHLDDRNGRYSAINDVLGTQIKPKYEDPRPGEIQRIYLDATRAREALGWSPTMPFIDGLRRTIEWHRACVSG